MNFRAGTIISETWEDGQALKDLNAQLVCRISFFPFDLFIEFIMHQWHLQVVA
jgi:hypothetical protein